jgi:hypothetical protein
VKFANVDDVEFALRNQFFGLVRRNGLDHASIIGDIVGAGKCAP